MHRSGFPNSTPTAVWVEFQQRLLANDDLDRLGYVLVNEARRLLDADRVTLLLERRGDWTTAAVSGQDLFDRRSNVVRALETFVAVVAPTRQAVYEEGGTGAFPPQVEAALAPLLDATHARRLAAVPLQSSRDDHADRTDSDDPQVIGWLVFEQFDRRDSGANWPELTTELAEAASPTLRKTLRYYHLPFRHLGEWVGSLSQGGLPSRGTIALVGAATLTAALFFLPARLRVDADGVMQPQLRRHVFAPDDGIVVELFVRQGERVAAGQKLLALRRPELDFELARLGGEIRTQEKRLTSVQAARLRNSVPLPGNELARLTAEEVEVEQQLEGLRRQLAELERRRDALSVASPLAGQVLTWDVERQLSGRPVQKGMQLLTIGNVDGPWELELHIPEEYVGHVRRARHDAASGPTVEFVSAAAAETTYSAELGELAVRSDVDVADRSTVYATAALDPRVPRDVLHPAAAVTAKIDCGRASLGYVWFADVIHLLRTRLFF